MLGEVPSVDVCSAIPASQYHKSSIWTLNAKAISLLPTFYDSCFISKACTKPSVFFSCLRTFFRLLFSFIYYLSCFIAHSSLQLLLRSNYIFCKLWYIHDTFRNFPEIIGYVSNNEESQVSQSKCSPIPFHWRDNKNTFKQSFFKLMFYQCLERFFPNRKRLFKQMYLLDMEKVVVFFHASVEKQVIMFSICTHD